MRNAVLLFFLCLSAIPALGETLPYWGDRSCQGGDFCGEFPALHLYLLNLATGADVRVVAHLDSRSRSIDFDAIMTAAYRAATPKVLKTYSDGRY